MITTPDRPKLYTVGHSNHPQEVFIQALKERGVNVLVDVRSRPVSRFCPHFNKAALSAALAEEGIAYAWRGDKLGGYAETGQVMAEALDALAAWAGTNPHKRAAMMCAEKKPQDCHRYRWLANYLSRSSNLEITNIMPRGSDWGVGEEPLPDLPQGLERRPWRVASESPLLRGAAARGYKSQEEAAAYISTRFPEGPPSYSLYRVR
jgi:hypothetical protein